MFTTIHIIAFILASIPTQKVEKTTNNKTLKIEMSRTSPALYKKIPTKWTKTLEK